MVTFTHSLFKRKRAFTLIEMMVVIAIIGILSALLIPAISVAKQKARSVKCISNLRQLSLGFTMYTDDHAQQLPPLNSGGPFKDPVTPHNPTNWWYRIISEAGYIPSVTNKNGIWRCPNVIAEDMYSPFEELMEGYGVVENNGHVPGLRSIMWYALDKDGKPAGSVRTGAIKRPSELWMVGDVGTPKDEDLDLAKFPYGGYYRTEITTFPPTSLGMWDQKPPKQPAVRHKLKANICFVDGHVEAWDYQRLSQNYRDVFAVTNR